MFTNEQLSNAMQSAADNFDSGAWEWRQDEYGFYGPDRDDDDAGSYCIIGGCAKALNARPGGLTDRLGRPLMICVKRLFPRRTNPYIVKFNDNPDTEIADVVAVLRCSAKEIIA